jgi:hypothetical protein
MTLSPRRSAGIRALEEDDVPQVARLWENVFGSRSPIPSVDAEDFLRRTLISSPRRDPDLPSLVYEQRGGRIVGFLGACLRRMTFDDRPVRAISSAHFMIDPTASAQGAGALLLGRLLSGPQELTSTDTASAATRALWRGLGGATSYLGSVSWVRIFQTSAVVDRALARRFGRQRWRPLRVPARLLCRLADPLLERGLRMVVPPSSLRNRQAVLSEPLTPANAAGNLSQITASFRLKPVYEEDYLESLFEDIDRFVQGVTVSRLLRYGEEPAGSYVYMLRPGDISPVLQVACREEDADVIVRALFDDARRRGAGALTGRVEPHLWESLTKNGALLYASDARRLLHSREPELLSALCTDKALMTRLDGEWW